MKIIFGTTNPRKVEDLKQIIKDANLDLEVLGMHEIGWDLGEIEENGTTIEENSLIKAQAIYSFCKEHNITYPIITDDAGLFVEELNTFLAREKEARDTKYGEESILFQDFEPVKVTEATRQHVLEHPEMYQNCPPRIREGKFYTDDEYERRAEEVLSTPLPGEDDKGIAFTKKDKRK